MRPSVLILTNPDDIHSFAVAAALDRKGARVTLWHTSDFPTRSSETVRFERNRRTLRIQGPETDLVDPRFDTVWDRRPAFVLDEDRLHPADRDFADLGCRGFRKNLLALLSPDAFWVNPPETLKGQNKLMQHAVAAELGFRTPDSLYTNDPDEIRRFIRQQGGKIVYKPVEGNGWRDGDTYFLSWTTPLGEDDLVDDDLLRAVPGIYQQKVPKAFEVRMNLMGRRKLSARILSQESERGRIDWRKAQHELTMEPFDVPPEVVEACGKLMERLGLVFGCLDFIVTPDGEYVFLEVNPMGQFLFLEDFAGIPVLDAFSEFLLQGRTDFDWDEQEVGITYADVVPTVRRMWERARELHVAVPSRRCDEARLTTVPSEP